MGSNWVRAFESSLAEVARAAGSDDPETVLMSITTPAAEIEEEPEEGEEGEAAEGDEEEAEEAPDETSEEAGEEGGEG